MNAGYSLLTLQNYKFCYSTKFVKAMSTLFNLSLRRAKQQTSANFNDCRF